MSQIITIRDIDIVATEIKAIERQVATVAIYGFIEIGRRLTEAKEIVGHGGWGKFLEEKVSYSQQWATNLMNLYKEYGGHQESLFESFANSQSFGNIDVTKHILLLGVPAEERAEFARAHDAEHSSVRELKEAIRQRDLNLQAANEQASRAEKAEAEVEKLTASVSQQADMLDAKDAEMERLRVQAQSAQKQQADADDKVEKLKKQLSKAKAAAKDAREALAQARAHPEIPESLMEQMRGEVAADAAAKATASLQKQLDDAQKDAAAAEARLRAAEEEIAAAKKQIQLSDPDMVKVNTYLKGVQEQFGKMVVALGAVAGRDLATADKVRGNIRDKVLPALAKMLQEVVA